MCFKTTCTLQAACVAAGTQCQDDSIAWQYGQVTPSHVSFTLAGENVEAAGLLACTARVWMARLPSLLPLTMLAIGWASIPSLQDST